MTVVRRKGAESMLLHYLIMMIIAVLIILVLTPVASGALNLVADTGCNWAYNIISWVISHISDKTMTNNC